ncbi:MAG: PAS domain-containing sensor histidine kinase [Minisyncoccia bacterium]
MLTEISDTIVANALVLSEHELFWLYFLGVIFIVVAVGVYAVLSARPRAENAVTEALAARNQAVAQLLEAEEIGHVGSFVYDFENPSSSYWSKEMYELFGLIPRKKIPPHDSLKQYIHTEDHLRFEDAWKLGLEHPGEYSCQVRSVSDRGQVRNLQLRFKTIFSKGKLASIHGAVHDVTKEMEVDRAKSEFVSLASHQLKTPLTSINWLSEMLLREGGEPLSPKQLEYVRSIKGSSQQMVEMVNDLLNMSRIELGTLAMTIEEFDINDLVREVIAEQQHAAELKKVTIKLTTDQFPKLKADRKLVRMILQNLLSNAIKYSRDGGTVEYELSPTSGSKEAVFLRVKDSGIGIPKEEQGKIFERLYRANNAQKSIPDGTGLGLYVVKIILARAGGGITFESVEGTGTTFFASIPMVWPAGEKAA